MNVESLALADMKKKLASEISFALEPPNHPSEEVDDFLEDIKQKAYNASNDNDLLLLQTCASHNLLITNTIFRLPDHKKLRICIHAVNTGISSIML